MSETPMADAMDRVIEAARQFINFPDEGESPP